MKRIDMEVNNPEIEFTYTLLTHRGRDNIYVVKLGPYWLL